MNVLVTGAGGFIGSTLVKKIVMEKGCNVKALVRPGGDLTRLKGVEEAICYGDLSNEKDIDAFMADYDCIYHLAAGTAGSHFEMMMNTVVATENLLTAMKNYNIKRFVLVSSLSVYQMTALKKNSVLDEKCPIEDQLAKRDPYTITKARQEKLVQEKCRELGVPLIILRPGKIYGVGDHPVPPQLGLAIPGICFLFIGDNHLIPLTHVSNCVDAIAAAGMVDSIAGEVFNIIDNDLPSQKKFLKLYKSIIGKLKRKIWMPYIFFKVFALCFEFASKKTKGNIPSVITRYRGENLWKKLRYDNSKAKTRLNWTPQVSIEKGLRDMFVEHVKQNESL